jgi:hypothetical protein
LVLGGFVRARDPYNSQPVPLVCRLVCVGVKMGLEPASENIQRNSPTKEQDLINRYIPLGRQCNALNFNAE